MTHDDNPAELMAFVTAELQRYLEQIFGKKLPKTPTGHDGPITRLSINENADPTDEVYELRA